MRSANGALPLRSSLRTFERPMLTRCGRVHEPDRRRPPRLTRAGGAAALPPPRGRRVPAARHAGAANRGGPFPPAGALVRCARLFRRARRRTRPAPALLLDGASDPGGARRTEPAVPPHLAVSGPTAAAAADHVGRPLRRGDAPRTGRPYRPPGAHLSGRAGRRVARAAGAARRPPLGDRAPLLEL